ncbi:MULTISPECIES: ATP-binding protein [unclassified Luteimonas]
MSGPATTGLMEFRASRLQDLARLETFLDSACAGIDDEARSDLRLAIEEVFVNIFAHGYGSDSGPVDIRVSHAPARVTVAIADAAPAFDPAAVPTPDLDADCSERTVGGLGWHLVRSVIDEVGWAPGMEGGNVYLLVKHVAAGTTDPRQRERSTHT